MYFAAVVGIDGTRGVQHGDAMSQGKPGSRANLPFDSVRKCNGNAGWNGCAFARRQHDGRIGRDCGNEIEPGGEFALIGRQRQVGGVWQPHHADLNPAHRSAPARVPVSAFVAFFIRHFYECRRQRHTSNYSSAALIWPFPRRTRSDGEGVRPTAPAIRRCARRARARPRPSIAAARIRRCSP